MIPRFSPQGTTLYLNFRKTLCDPRALRRPGHPQAHLTWPLLQQLIRQIWEYLPIMRYRRQTYSHLRQTEGSCRQLKVRQGKALSSDQTVAGHLYPTADNYLCNIIAIVQLI